MKFAKRCSIEALAFALIFLVYMATFPLSTGSAVGFGFIAGVFFTRMWFLVWFFTESDRSSNHVRC